MEIWIPLSCLAIGAGFFAWSEKIRKNAKPIMQAVKESLTLRELPSTTASVLTLIERISKSDGFQDVVPAAQDVVEGRKQAKEFEDGLRARLVAKSLAATHIQDMESILTSASDVIEDRLEIDQRYNEAVNNPRKTMSNFIVAGACGLVAIVLENVPATEFRGVPASVASLLILIMAIFAILGCLGIFFSFASYYRFVRLAENENHDVPATPFELPTWFKLGAG